MIDPTPFLGLPYEDRGRTRRGVDCWGLIALVSREALGRDVPTYDGYPASDCPAVADWIRRWWGDWTEIPLGQEQPGDVVALAVAGRPVHAGLVIAPGRMLHVLPQRPACVETFASGIWRRSLQRIGRWAG